MGDRDGKADADMRSPFTAKGLVVGTILSAFVGLAAPYAIIILQGSWMAMNSSAPGAIFLFFVLAGGLNVVISLLSRRLALSRGDLILVYVMLLVASTVPTQAFLGYLIPVISGLTYFATPENNWGEIFMPYVPEWLVPQDWNAIRYLHEGLPSGMEIPWHVWVQPLGSWFAFFLALSLLMVCLSTILHRQWSRHERLAYPMVQLPLAIIDRGADPLARLSPFLRNPVMWVGFAVPFCLFGLTGLHHYIPTLPRVPFTFAEVWVLNRTVWLEFTLSYAWIGFFYLVSLEITGSVWFFFLFSKLQEAAFNSLGISSSERLSLYSSYQTADLTHQAMGACLVFVLYGLWMGRRHLRDVWRKAWGRAPEVDDSEELMPYRLALLGLVGSLVFAAFWLHATGISWRILALLLPVCLVFYIYVSRIVATAGVATARSPMVAAFFIISAVGTPVVGAKGLVALTFTYIWQSEMRVFPMIAVANGLKLAEAVRGPKGRLFWGIGLALVASLAAGTWIILTTCYADGGINLHRFFMTSQPLRVFGDMTRPLLNPTPPDVRGWVFTGIGAAVQALLMLAQHRLLWWPLHPLGYPMSIGFLTGIIWFSAFVSWLLKLAIVRYGGQPLYSRLRPLFLGLILGEACTGGFWLVVDWLTGTTGNMITTM